MPEVVMQVDGFVTPVPFDGARKVYGGFVPLPDA